MPRIKRGNTPTTFIKLDLPQNLYGPNEVENEVFGRRLFLSYLANSLVLEKNKLVPWRLTDYVFKHTNSLSELMQFDVNDIPILPLIRSDYFYAYIPPKRILHNVADPKKKSEFFISLPAVYKAKFGIQKIEYANHEVSRVIPSDPSEIFIWMYYQGIITKSSNNKSDNKLRELARDNLVYWWANNETHATSFSEDFLKIFPNKSIRKGDALDYRSSLFGGSGSIPAVKIFSGHCVKYFDYINMINKEKLVNLYAPFARLLKFRGGTNLDEIKEAYIRNSPSGCWGASSALSFAFRAMNIPAYASTDTFMPGHSSLILPAEPNPQKPTGWFLLHADDLYINSIQLQNPLNPVPTSSLFWTLERLKVEMAAAKGRDFKTEPSNVDIFNRLPSIWENGRLAHEEFALGRVKLGHILKYLDRALEVEKNYRRDLISKFPSLKIIVGALLLSKDMNQYLFSFNYDGQSCFVGPRTSYIYGIEDDILKELDIAKKYIDAEYAGNKILVEQYIAYFIRRSSQALMEVISLVTTPSRLKFFLDKARLKTGVLDEKENVRYYWSLFDKATEEAKTAPTTKNYPPNIALFLKVNFDKECAPGI